MQNYPMKFHFNNELPVNREESRIQQESDHTTYDDNYPLTYDYSDVSELI